MNIGNGVKGTELSPAAEDMQTDINAIQVAARGFLAPCIATDRKRLRPSEEDMPCKRPRLGPSPTLNTLPEDLLVLICEHLGVASLRLISVNHRLNSLFKHAVLNQLHIGYRSLVSIMQISHNCPQSRIKYAAKAVVLNALADSILTFAQVSSHNEWLVQLNTRHCFKYDLLSPEQFKKMIYSNMHAAVSYLSLLLSMRPGFSFCAENDLHSLVEVDGALVAESCYASYITKLLNLMAELLPFAEKSHCMHWLSELAEDWEIENFDADFNIKDLPHCLRGMTEQYAHAKSKRYNFYEHRNDSDCDYDCNRKRTIYSCLCRASQALKEYPELVFQIIRVMFQFGFDIGNHVHYLADLTNVDVGLAEVILSEVNYFYEVNWENSPNSWLVGVGGDSWNLLSYIAKRNCSKAFAMALAIEDESGFNRRLAALHLSEYAWQSLEWLDAILELLTQSERPEYMLEEDPLALVLHAIEEKLDLGLLKPQEAAPLIERINDIDLCIMEQDQQLAGRAVVFVTDEYAYSCIKASVFGFLAFHNTPLVKTISQDIIKRILSSSFDELRLKCIKALLHLDINNIHLAMGYDLTSVMAKVMMLVIEKSHAMALEITKRYLQNDPLKFTVLLEIAKNLDHSVEDDQIGADILRLMQSGSRERDLILEAFSNGMAFHDFSLSLQTAALILDEQIKVGAYLFAYGKKPLLAKKHFDDDREAVLKTIEVRDNPLQSSISELMLYSYIDLVLFFAPIDELLSRAETETSPLELGLAYTAVFGPIFEKWDAFSQNKTLVFGFFTRLAAFLTKMDDFSSEKLSALQWLKDHSLYSHSRNSA